MKDDDDDMITFHSELFFLKTFWVQSDKLMSGKGFQLLSLNCQSFDLHLKLITIWFNNFKIMVIIWVDSIILEPKFHLEQ